MKKIIALLMALMLVASVAAISAGAATADDNPSPTAVPYYSMTAEARPANAGKAEVDPAKVEVGSDGTVTFTATETTDAKFVRWEFQCEYDVVSGTVENDISYDKVVVLKPKSDIHGIAYFEGADTATKDQKNNDTTSPKTGDMTLVFAGVLLLGLGAAVFAFKKIKE